MIGKTVGPYEVTASIGRGGMGEVFKAHDKKLGRDVALKFLPATLAQDTERLQRFEREARVLASLQHQNIAMMFGLEEFDGQPVMAMELAAGEDLSTRLLRGPLPANEIEKIAQQLAAGLEFAHEKGIVHRDLKPANVKVAGDGEVKILDFGLARAVAAETGSPGSDESASYQPTITQALTGVGTVLGTAAYMSPEQARGYEVDRRCDIWAFGALLYEMMTGERLFQGATVADTLAAVLHKEPDWSVLEADQPPILVQICRRCLEKEANQRLRDIGEARVALEGSASSVIGLTTSALTGDLAGPPPQPKKGGPWWLVAVLAVALVGALWVGWQGLVNSSSVTIPLVRSTVLLPEGISVNLFPAGPGPGAVSPNGRYLCFVAVDSTAATQMMIHDFESGEFWILDDTQNAVYPFWSHDSREVAFGVNGGIMRKSIAGGPTIFIANTSNFKGGSWNQFDQIIYAPSHNSPIMMTTREGDEPVAVTAIAQEEDARSHRLPQWFPDGKQFLFTAVLEANSQNSSTFDCMAQVGNLLTTESVDLIPTQSSAVIAHGHVLYVRDSTLMARKIDPNTLVLENESIALLPEVGVLRAAHLSVLSANESDVLVYSIPPGVAGLRQVVRYDRNGEEIEKVDEPVNSIGLDLSDDGRYICYSVADDKNGTLDIWVYDIQRGFAQQLTFGSETEWVSVFSPDGKTMALTADYEGKFGLFRVSLARGGSLELLSAGEGEVYFPSSYSPDGALLYGTVSDLANTSWLFRLDLATKDFVRVHPQAQHSEYSPEISPDGHWLAYTSDESGSLEVYIESIEHSSERWRVSNSGGSFPLWSPDGDIIYYESAENKLVAIPIAIADGNVVMTPGKVILLGINSSFLKSCDIDMVTGDIMVQRSVAGGRSRYMNLVVGWDGLFGTDQR